MLSIFKLNKKNIYYLAFFLLTVLLALVNYSFGTVLSGWDNLHTEFNPLLNISRGLFGVWLDFQSFGNTSGMAYPTTLFHALYTGFFDIFLPFELIRFLYVFAMFFLALVFAFKLFVNLGFDEEKKPYAALASLFYVFSLPNLQLFSLPTESFITFIALFPLQIHLFLSYLKSKSKKDLYKYAVLFCLANILGAVQFLTQTMFVVLLLVMAVFVLEELLTYQHKMLVLRKSVLFFLLTIIVNSYWILPQIYFLLTSSNVVFESKINQISTPTMVLQNESNGSILDFVRGYGVYMDLFGADGKLILGNWLDYFSNGFVGFIPFLLFFIIFLGFFRKSKHHLGFLFLLLIVCIALLNIPPFNWLLGLFREIPILNQIFRSTFTKFASLYALVFAFFFVSGLDLLSNFIFNTTKWNGLRSRTYFLSLLSLTLLFILNWPVFSGKLFPNFLKVSYSDDYTNLVSTFNSQIPKEDRVAMVPDVSFWGWYKHSWGYEGSGFLWYSIPQPVISRTFDVWGFPSESFYWESKYALETKNHELLAQVLSKYNVKWLVFDESLKPLSSESGVIKYPVYKEVLTLVPNLTEYSRFGSVILYKFDIPEISSTASIYSDLPFSIMPETQIIENDKAFQNTGTYINNDNPDYIYPFLNLTSKTSISDFMWAIYETPTEFTIVYNSEVPLNDYNIVFPSPDLLSGNVFDGTTVYELTAGIIPTLEEKSLKLSLEKKLVQNFGITSTDVTNCGFRGGTVTKNVTSDGLIVSSKDGGLACFGFNLPFLAHWNSYLLSVDIANISNNPFYLYILGGKSEKFSRYENYLTPGFNRIIIPTGYDTDDGYIFSYQNESFGNLESKNILKSMNLYFFPYDFITGIRLEKKDKSADIDADQFNHVITTKQVKKINSFVYEIADVRDTKFISLWQSYDKGWILVCGFSICKDFDHVKVNNWANGWTVSNNYNQSVYIIYWPQFLQYLGYLIMFLGVGWVLLKLRFGYSVANSD